MVRAHRHDKERLIGRRDQQAAGQRRHVTAQRQAAADAEVSAADDLQVHITLPIKIFIIIISGAS